MPGGVSGHTLGPTSPGMIMYGWWLLSHWMSGAGQISWAEDVGLFYQWGGRGRKEVRQMDGGKLLDRDLWVRTGILGGWTSAGGWDFVDVLLGSASGHKGNTSSNLCRTMYGGIARWDKAVAQEEERSLRATSGLDGETQWRSDRWDHRKYWHFWPCFFCHGW